MRTQVLLLLSVIALGAVTADIYYINSNIRRVAVKQLEPKRAHMRGMHVVKTVSLTFDKVADVNTDTDTDTDTDTGNTDTDSGNTNTDETDTQTDTFVETTASNSHSASASATGSHSKSVTASKSPSPSPSISKLSCSACATNAHCSERTGTCVCDDRYDTATTSPLTCSAQKSVSGSFTFAGTAADVTADVLDSLADKIATKTGVDKSNVVLSVSSRKTVTITYVIYIPSTQTTVTITTVTADLSDNASMLTLVNSVLTSFNLPTVSSINVVVAATPSPSPSASPSVHSKKSKSLSDGAIAGIVIGSVAGAVLLVALLVFLQMRFHSDTKKRHTNSMATAKAVDDEGPARKQTNDALNQRL